LIRVSLAADDLGDAAKKLERLYPRVAGSAEAHSELMLISAELAMAATDVAGAVQLATAALNPGDDRAAALLAEIALRESSDDISRINQLLTAVDGRRFDTLAQRVRLARRLGIAIGFDIPPAAKELAARGEGR
jgi:thioredoxin-like negative regulator of GroEL